MSDDKSPDEKNSTDDELESADREHTKEGAGSSEEEAGSSGDGTSDGVDDEEEEDEDGASPSGAEAEEPAGQRRSRRRAAGQRDVDEALAEPVTPLLKPNYVFLAVTSILFLAADLGSKYLAVKKLGDKPNDKYVVIKNFFNFDLAQNKGGAWGLLGDQPDNVRLPFFFIISGLAVVFIVSLYRKLEPQQKALRWALPLVLGGALGNLIDRLRHQYVVDFIDWYVVLGGKPNHWPTFNIADVWIVVGVGLMVVDMFTPRRRITRTVIRPQHVQTLAAKMGPDSSPSTDEVKDETKTDDAKVGA